MHKNLDFILLHSVIKQVTLTLRKLFKNNSINHTFFPGSTNWSVEETTLFCNN